MSDHGKKRSITEKELRASRRAEGLCVLCGDPPERFKRYCSKCLRIRAEQSRRYYKRHGKKERALRKARYDHHKKQGLCICCGNKLVRDMEPGVRCVHCAEAGETCRLLSGG